MFTVLVLILAVAMAGGGFMFGVAYEARRLKSGGKPRS